MSSNGKGGLCSTLCFGGRGDGKVVSVRKRDVKNRLMLFRECYICGKAFATTADTPFVRQITGVLGKKQKTCYFCSEKCKNASYRHRFDGTATERRLEYERIRSKEKNRKYYQRHSERLRAQAKERYWSNPEESRAINAYQRRKRALTKKMEALT